MESETKLYVYDAHKSEFLWDWKHEYILPAGPSTGPQLFEESDFLFFVSGMGLYAINPETGDTVWKIRFFNFGGGPLLADAGKWLIVGPVLEPPKP